MNLKSFFEKFDVPNSVVLLEGKREVKAEDEAHLNALGKLLTENTQHILFRSGNAKGADFLFSQGVISVDKNRLQVVTPYSSHRSKQNYASSTVSLDSVDLLKETEVVYQSKKHKGTEKLIDPFVAGKRDRFTLKAAYILRDTVKVIGADGIPAANFAFFYDDLENPKSRGTGHTMRVCEENGVESVDQRVWMEWVR